MNINWQNGIQAYIHFVTKVSKYIRVRTSHTFLLIISQAFIVYRITYTPRCCITMSYGSPFTFAHAFISSPRVEAAQGTHSLPVCPAESPRRRLSSCDLPPSAGGDGAASSLVPAQIEHRCWVACSLSSHQTTSDPDPPPPVRRGWSVGLRSGVDSVVAHFRDGRSGRCGCIQGFSRLWSRVDPLFQQQH